ncbi:TetR/AcrR family transcriptional regulator [Actinokineospora fastidiosa]|uniref:TetR family transcriptional regulator n=1 Tax=Actinokineospora fastidiosa TaxID=1816 RepID=A0A918GQK7_9PSEU|nr:TetR/AcrR family transcriptional regulator [Actinokineospora fastidiosa]GGS50531.1 TetR family transcriptional regulator [Actinokineospora fastidiosa]
MAEHRTTRHQARAAAIRQIKDEARRQLREDGVHNLSLRGVARSMGFVSSAIYRYFPSRDELLTALIIDAYDALGEAAEQADDPGAPRAQRWARVCRAVRAWALANPAEYMLIYGSPIPGYQAPRDTVGPATRVAKVLTTIAEDAPDSPLSPTLAKQMTDTAAALDSPIAPGAMARVVRAWTQVSGMVSFELFGQFRGAIEPADEFFDAAVADLAEQVGLGS